MFGQDRTAMRRFFVETWRKHQQQQHLEPLEQIIAKAIQLHPEYHRLLEQPDLVLDQEFHPEAGRVNPFLHLGMHIGLQEQVTADRPAGIATIYRELLLKSDDPHQAEHQLMQCLEQVLWEAQQSHSAPDDASYLECARKLLS
jgi:hypothetical protein